MNKLCSMPPDGIYRQTEEQYLGHPFPKYLIQNEKEIQHFLCGHIAVLINIRFTKTIIHFSYLPLIFVSLNVFLTHNL